MNANLDPSEVDKFNDLANQWWDLKGPFQPLHELNPLRVSFIQKICPVSDLKVLDVGCGGGILAERLAQLGATVSGIDAAPDSIAVAQQHAEKSGFAIDYTHCMVEDYAQSHAEGFDVITCMEMLEHVPDPASVISSIARMLRPKGYAFFSTLNRTPKSFVQAIVGAEYVLGLIPRGTHSYSKFIRPSELAKTAAAHGLLCQRMQGLTYNPLTRRYRFTDDLKVNYLMGCQKDA